MEEGNKLSFLIFSLSVINMSGSLGLGWGGG